MTDKAKAEKQTRTVVGKVVSNKMHKTIVVSIERTVRHEKYGKYQRFHSKRFAHDEQGICKEGDTVKIKESRPISKLKSWVLVEVLSSSSV